MKRRAPAALRAAVVMALTDLGEATSREVLAWLRSHDGSRAYELRQVEAVLKDDRRTFARVPQPFWSVRARRWRLQPATRATPHDALPKAVAAHPAATARVTPQPARPAPLDDTIPLIEEPEPEAESGTAVRDAEREALEREKQAYRERQRQLAPTDREERGRRLRKAISHPVAELSDETLGIWAENVTPYIDSD